jgi:hypothetical protein
MAFLVGSNAPAKYKAMSSNYGSGSSGSSSTPAPSSSSSAPKTTQSTPAVSGSTIVMRGAPVYDNNGKQIGSIDLTQDQVNSLWQNNPTLAQKMGVPKATGPGTSTPSVSSQPTTLQQLSQGINSGAIQTQQDVNNLLANQSTVKQQLESAVDMLVASGKTVNPNIKFDDISIEQFLLEAEKTIAPEFKQKFQTTIQDLNTTLNRLGYDLNNRIEEVKRTAEKVRLQGREALAGRGTAFSSDRSRFEEEVTDSAARDEEHGRELTFRAGEDAFSATERYLGTDQLKSAGVPTSIAGRQLNFSGNPVIGSMESEKQYAKESIARQLQTDEYSRRAYALTSLGFQ